MNDQNERNEKLNRIFAAIGLVFAIILLAWLAIQVVRFIPVAFSSLASVFEANQRDLQEELASDDDEEAVVVVEDDNDSYDDETVSDETSDEVDDEIVDDEYEDTADTDDSYTDTSGGTGGQTQYQTVATYQVPVSDPNGYTDLEVTFVAFGHMTSSERFVPDSDLERDETAAMQFTVKNIGTKTSANWHFEAELPDDRNMTSRVQLPLKPAEVATFTVLFETGDDRGHDYIGAAVTGGNDINSKNNDFRTRVNIR